MFLDWLKFVNEDFRLALNAMEPKDWAYPSYAALWLIILFFPLNKIDRQDPVAGLDYILFCLAAGATLFFAFPENFNRFSDISFHVGILTFMGMFSAYRWFHRNNQTLTKEEAENQKKEGS